MFGRPSQSPEGGRRCSNSRLLRASDDVEGDLLGCTEVGGREREGPGEGGRVRCGEWDRDEGGWGEGYEDGDGGGRAWGRVRDGDG